MRITRPVPLLALAVTATLFVGSAAHNASAARLGQRVPAGTQMLLSFDQEETFKSGALVRDASGHGHRGVVLTRNGGAVRAVPGWHRRGVAFPTRCCGRAIIEVADRRGMDPRRRPFVFGAAVKIGPARERVGSNVVQKGYFNQPGGQYKIQLLPGGAPSCVIRGGKARVILKAQKSVADRSWHRLTCTRTPISLQLRVDGRVVAGQRGAVGFIGNDSPLRIGGKNIKPQNKQYRGRLDSVFLRLL